MRRIEIADDGNYYGIAYAQLQNWPTANPPDIVHLELMAVYVMTSIQPRKYANKAILLRVYNEAVCAITRKKSACLERKDLQQLIRLICEIAIKYKFYYWIKWISTKDNVRADGLSREEPTAMQICNNKNLQNRNIGAIKCATKAIEEHKQINVHVIMTVCVRINHCIKNGNIN